MDAEHEALSKQNQILKAKLERALKQRDAFMGSLHHIMRTPHAERTEIKQDCDRDLEKFDADNG